MADVRGKTLVGRFSHAPVCGAIETWEKALISVDHEGLITESLQESDPRFDQLLTEAENRGTLIRTPSTSWILPGFVDLHLHAAQYPQLGSALDLPLEQWLEHYTFPLEARFADVEYAQAVYATLVEDLLAAGTTTALMFATIHQEATQALVDISLDCGLRALIGKVAADDAQQCPDFYRDGSVAAALDGTEALIDYVRGPRKNQENRVLPVVTPRFVPSCTDETLHGLAALAARYDTHVQTHCSESDWAENYVQQRTGRRDAEYLDALGLLTPKTVLAHAVFLSETDMELIQRRSSGIAHCALSNAYFADAVFPLRTALEKGLHVGLGTDISGGPSMSMRDAITMTVTASRMLDRGVDASLQPAERGRPGAAADWRTAFHLATAGGGTALELNVGVFEPGYAFDAQLVDTAAEDGTIRRFADTGSSDPDLAKILYTASLPNIAEVWVAGESVAGRNPL